jgi:mannose-1-phosphate guanylyltransferase
VDDRTFAVLMAGGSGTRFWPLSRRRRPKQVLPFAGGVPLARAAFERVRGLVPPERVLVVTGADQVAALREILPEIPPDGFLVEPAPRNTAPCLGLAAVEAERRRPGALLLNLPADHVIEPVETFRETARRALARADAAGALVTFGIAPTRPATGYGWIRLGPETAPGVHAVARFTEKPDAATAEGFLADGGYRWNGGLFAWRADAFLGEVRTHLPALAEGLDALTADPARLGGIFPGLPEISVDFAVMERTSRAEVCLADFRWDDVGSLEALARLLPPDGTGNHGIGALLTLDGGSNVVVAPPGHLVAGIGVHDLVVIATPDVTLVCPRDRAEEVSRLVKELRRRGREDLL